MYSFDSKEINEHKAEDANGLQFGRKLAREERKFGEISSFVANDKMREFARPWSSSIWKDECSIVLHEILLHVLTGRCHSGNSQTILGRNFFHDLQHQTYHDMLYRFMNVWYHCLCVAMCFVWYCFIFRVVGFAGRGDPIKRLEYPCLTPTVVTSSQLQCFSMLQLIEHYDVKIFLILALFDWIAATFLSDPHPSNTTGSFQVSRTKCQSNRLLYSVAGATKDAFGRLKCIHLVPWWVHHSGPVRQCSEVYRGWRLSFGKKSSDWEKRVFDIGIQWNKQYKQDNDGQWYKIRFASEWIVNWLIDVDRDLVMRWHLGKWQKSMALFSSSPRSLCRGKPCLEPTLDMQQSSSLARNHIGRARPRNMSMEIYVCIIFIEKF